LNSVIDLAELLLHPEQVSAVPTSSIPYLRGELAKFDTMLLARILDERNRRDEKSNEFDQLLNVQQAAAKLGVSVDYIYKRAPVFPFTVREGRRVLFSQQGVERYLLEKMNKKGLDV
jgi:hypothetical protein